MAPSESTPGPSNERPRKRSRNHPYSLGKRFTGTHGHEDTLPGVQKLKSALRQTKRLLARDHLAADVRVETERRLRALEGDLVRAEGSRKERQHSAKYHKVKFFERQKVLRKIKQTKRNIAASSAKREKEKLESVLADLRVDLNYVLNFPKTEKYISLFPPEVRSSGSTAPVAAASDDNEERMKTREMIRQKMVHGQLSNEPENELGKLDQGNKQVASGWGGASVAPSIKASLHTDEVASDDFFGDDDEEDSEQSEASDP